MIFYCNFVSQLYLKFKTAFHFEETEKVISKSIIQNKVNKKIFKSMKVLIYQRKSMIIMNNRITKESLLLFEVIAPIPSKCFTTVLG